jgi:O-antigen ligase
VIIMMGATSFMLVPSDVKQIVITRFDPRESEDVYEYTRGRTLLWSNGLKMFMERPIFGHGANTFVPLMKKKFQILGNSHNDYLLHLVHYGLVGLLIFVLILVKVFQHIWYRIKTVNDLWSKRLYISYLAGFSGYAVSMLSVNVIIPRLIFWLYTGLIYKYGQLEMSEFE